MIVFAVFRQGVGRHECGGIFTDLQVAKETAQALADCDVDDWHRYEVVPYTLDRPPCIGLPASDRFSPDIQEAEPVFSVEKA